MCTCKQKLGSVHIHERICNICLSESKVHNSQLPRFTCFLEYFRISFFSWRLNKTQSCIRHIFPCPSSADGHLCCLHLLTVARRAAANMEVQVSMVGCRVLEVMPRSGMAGSEGSASFNLSSPSMLVSTMASLVCTPTNSKNEFLFPYILTSVCCLFPGRSPLYLGEMEPPNSFHLYCPDG